MKNILIYSLVFVCLSSCVDRIEEDTHTLQQAEVVSIPIDSLTTSINQTIFYKDPQNDKSFIAILNENIPALQFYSLQDKKLVKKIYLSTEGPNSIGQVSAFYVHSLDSIFLLASYNFSLALTDTSGVLKNKYKLLQDNIKYNGFGPPPISTGKNDYVGRPISDNVNPIVLESNNIITRSIPAIDPITNAKLFFDLGKVSFKFDITSKSIAYLMGYPTLYKQIGEKLPLQLIEESFCFNKDEKTLIYSFPCDNDIYVLNLKDESIKNYSATSKYFEKVKIPSKRIEDTRKESEFAANNYHFERIIYDTYRKVYYRFVWIPDFENPFSFSNPDKPFKVDFSVIILDSDFKKIGEVMLPKNIMNTAHFITPEGIFFQSDSDENHLNFTRFTLVKKSSF